MATVCKYDGSGHIRRPVLCGRHSLLSGEEPCLPELVSTGGLGGGKVEI